MKCILNCTVEVEICLQGHKHRLERFINHSAGSERQVPDTWCLVSTICVMRSEDLPCVAFCVVLGKQIFKQQRQKTEIQLKWTEEVNETCNMMWTHRVWLWCWYWWLYSPAHNTMNTTTHIVFVSGCKLVVSCSVYAGVPESIELYVSKVLLCSMAKLLHVLPGMCY